MRRLNKVYWPANVKLDFDENKVSDAIRWCKETLGNANYRCIGAATFYFRNEQDAAFFSLRWA